ncbi:MAG: hypothetical protein HY689_09595 [Chloroflexi bacterium]|nr:hypothetical protein [Chloroflexota bacterium]
MTHGARERYGTLSRLMIIGAAWCSAFLFMGCRDGAPSASTVSPTADATRTPPRTSPAPTGVPAATARWVLLPPASTAPAPRRDHTLTFDTDRGVLYLFGGRTGGLDAFDDLWTFDPTTARWTRVAVSGPQPSARFGHNAFYDATAKRLVVTLGQATATTFFHDTWSFDPVAASWSELGAGSAERPATRYGAGGAYDAHLNRFLVSHGFTNLGRFDDTWILDLGVQQWRKVATQGAIPEQRCLVRAWWEPSSGRLLLFGGQSNRQPFLGDFWSLDVASGRWTEKQQVLLPSPRHLYGAAADDRARRWYLFGGNTANGAVGDTWVYDAAQDGWSLLIDPGAAEGPSARYGADITVAGERLFLFGGNDGTGDLADMWALPLPPAR